MGGQSKKAGMFRAVWLMGWLIAAPPLAAQQTAFTYQGQLDVSGTQAASYDFQADVFAQGCSAEPCAGTPLNAAPLLFPGVALVQGRFLLSIDPGAEVFTGPERFLQLRVRRAGEGSFTTLLPRQKITATPYAQHASDADFAAQVAPGSVGATQLAAGAVVTSNIANLAVTAAKIDATQVQRRISGSCPAGSAMRGVDQNGTAPTCEAIPGTSGFWSTSGNTATSGQFLGTFNAQPLELRSNNQRVARWEVSGASVNVLMGYPTNAITAGVAGAAIGGGGSSGNGNRVTDSFGTIGGGANNRAGDDAGSINDAGQATVSGGSSNIASGQQSTIGGGGANSASGQNSAVGGGGANTASGVASTVGGGGNNNASGGVSTVGGGSNNSASGQYSAVVGGGGNTASGQHSTVGGGSGNTASGNTSTAGGGHSNTASGNQSTVSGGSTNTALGISSTVSGGEINCAGGAASWAGGTFAKVRPPSGTGADPEGAGCDNVENSPSSSGDAGTFVWADRQFASFVSNGPNRILVRAQDGMTLQRSGTAARSPRAYLNVVRGDSGLPLAENPINSSAVAVFENDNGASLYLIAGGSENKALRFGDADDASQGGIHYTPTHNMQFRTNGNVTRMSLSSSGVLTLPTLGSAGSTSLCHNASNQIATCSSSARYKQAIEPLDLGLDAVLRLRPVGYEWRDSGMPDVGFVAEEVAQIDERLVTRNAEGEIEGVRYERLTAVLAGAVQDLAARESLARESNEALRADVDALRAELAQLRALLTRKEH